MFNLRVANIFANLFNILRCKHTCSHQTENIDLIWQKYSTEYSETIFLQHFLQISRTLSHRNNAKAHRALQSKIVLNRLTKSHIFLTNIQYTKLVAIKYRCSVVLPWNSQGKTSPTCSVFFKKVIQHQYFHFQQRIRYITVCILPFVFHITFWAF